MRKNKVLIALLTIGLAGSLGWGMNFKAAAYNEIKDLSVATVSNATSCNATFNGVLQNEFEINEDGKLVKYSGSGTYVEIPEGVKEIGPYVFDYNWDIKSVVIPESVLKIDECAFQDCLFLSQVEFKCNNIVIEERAFYGCDSLETLELPNCINKLGNSAFADCESLVEIILPHEIREIGTNVFASCQLLESVVIPDNYTELGIGMFHGCENLKEIKLPPGIKELPDYLLGNCRRLSQIVIPNQVTTINEDVFYGCKSLENVIIPKSVTRIGSQTFGNCISLKEVTIPEEVSIIENRLFEGCVSLHQVSLPDSIEKIGEYAFYNCNVLEELYIPDSVKELGESAFYGCNRIVTLNLPQGLNEIPDQLFSNCYELNALILPDGIKLIGNGAFLNCTSLRTITIPDSVENIGEYAFAGCDQLLFIELPDQIQRLEEGTFQGCKALEEVIASGVDYIADGGYKQSPNEYGILYTYGTFAFCSGLKNVKFSEKLSYIGRTAFAYCTSLEKFEISSNVTKLRKETFKGCTSLKEIHIPDSVLEIEGGDSWNAEGMFYGCTSLEKVILPSMITYLGRENFYGCSSLKDIRIPLSVEKIDMYAFKGCQSLKKVVLYPEVTDIAEDAFEDCNSLILFGAEGSYAEEYARLRGIPFQNIAIPYLNLTLKYEEVLPEDGKAAPNEKIFKITAVVENDGNLPDKSVQVKLSLPAGLQVYDSDALIKIVELNENVNEEVVWIVKAIQKAEPQKLRYTVHVDDGDLIQLSQYQTILVENTNDLDIFTDNDKWGFSHSRKAGFTSYSCGSLYKKLVEGLKNSEKKEIDKIIKSEWGGSCYGMSLAALLCKIGKLQPDHYAVKETGKTLKALTFSETEEIINYYQLTQYTDAVKKRASSVMELSEQDKIQKIIDLIKEDKAHPILLGFSYEQNCIKAHEEMSKGHKKCYKAGDKKSAGHEVVLYGDIEKGSFLMDNTTYDARIPIYDINSLSEPLNQYVWTHCYLYFTEGEDIRWLIKDANSFAEASSGYWERTSIVINDICNDVEELNYKNPEEDNRTDEELNLQASIFSYNQIKLKLKYKDKFTEINGLDTAGNLPVKVYYTPNSTQDGESTVFTNIILPENEGTYEITPENGEVDLSIDFPGNLLMAEGDKCKKVTVNSIGKISMDLDEGNYNLTVINEENVPEFPYYDFNITGSCKEQVSLTKEVNDYLLISDNLKNVQITLKNDVTEKKLRIDTEEPSVKIGLYGDEGEVAVRVDQDQDGIYEKIISTTDAAYDQELSEKIVLNVNSLTMKIQEKADLSLTAYPSDLKPSDFEWISSDPDIASVDNGVVTACKIGKALITVRIKTNPEIFAQCSVIVNGENDNSHTDGNNNHDSENGSSGGNSGSGGSGGGGSSSGGSGGGGGGGSKRGSGGGSVSGPNQSMPDTYPGAQWIQFEDGRWKLLKTDGNVATGWALVKNRWYYLSTTDGFMVTGWQLINGKWYYLNPDGSMVTDWILMNGVWYYLDKSGAMVTGWQFINGKWYYFDGSGAMLSNTITPDGYRVEADGSWVS